MIPVVLIYQMRRGRLSRVWSQSRTGSLVRRQEYPHDRIPMVPCLVGQTDELEGSFRIVPRQLGSCIHVGNTGRFVGESGIGTSKRPKRSGLTKCNGGEVTSTKPWCTKSTQAANVYFGLAPTARPRRCCVSSASWARSERCDGSSFAAICGKAT